MTVSNVSLKTIGPIVTKFYVERSGIEGTKLCPNDPGPMTNMIMILIT